MRQEVDNSVLDAWHYATRSSVIHLATRQNGGFSCDIVVQDNDVKKSMELHTAKENTILNTSTIEAQQKVIMITY